MYILCTLFSCFLCLLLRLFHVIFVLVGIYFYNNCDFLLFCGKALSFLSDLFSIILQVAIHSGVVLYLASYLLSSTVDSVFPYCHYCLCSFVA